MRPIQNKSQPVDARTIRKVSRLYAENAVTDTLPSESQPTDSGFIAAGIETTNFNMYVKVIAASCSEPTVKHAKKTRIFRVLSGEGIIVYKEENKKAVTQILLRGQQFECKPEMVYTIGSTGNSHLELLVVEDSKYEARLEIIAKVENPDVESPNFSTDSLEKGLTPNEDTKRRYSEKAKEIQQGLADERNRYSGHVGTTALPSNFVPLINAMPVMPSQS